MRLAAVIAAALVAVGAAGAAYRPSPLLPLDGAYRAADGTVYSLAVTPDGGLLYTNTRTGDLRQLSPAGSGKFTFGPAYLARRPVRGTVTVKGARLAIGPRAARRILVRRTTVSFEGAGVRLAGKITAPATPGLHPAVAIVHGSEAGDRDSYDLLVNVYSSLGYVVLTYDKRGVGGSGGAYQEAPTPGNVDNLAGDAIGALRILAARKDVDPTRIGLAGSSQAGWVIPHAAARSQLVRFAVIVSGPAVSVGEQGLYANLTGQGTRQPTQAEIDEQLANAEPGGFDPRADLARLSIPTLWLYGADDKVVYAPQSAAAVRALPDATVEVFPHADHFLLDTPGGLSSRIGSAHRFVHLARLAAWLRGH